MAPRPQQASSAQADEINDNEAENVLAEPLLAAVCDDEDELSQSPPGSRQSNLSPNVPLTLWYTALAFIGRSLWSQSVLSTYVYLIQSDDPEAVGFITAVMGLGQLVASFPAGYLADLRGRQTMLRASAVVAVLAILMTLGAVYLQTYFPLVLALAIWGVFWGINSPALGALFADSIPNGRRSKWFTRRAILIKLGYTMGPILALASFYIMGNQWTIPQTSVVMVVGQLLSVPAIFLLCFLKDDSCVEQDEQETSLDENNDSRSSHGDDETGNLGAELLITPGDDDENTDVGYEPLFHSNSTPDVRGIGEQPPSNPSLRCFWLNLPEHRVIPVMVATADVISGLGSGMSVRYFPIFFVDNLSLNPVVVQVLYILSPVGQAITMYATQVLSKKIGRCRVTVLFKWAGALFMIAMVFVYEFWDPQEAANGRTNKIWLISILYLIRTTLMNSTSALTKSMLMDHVPPSERSRWTSLESVNMFSWSGSAAFGGLLVGWKGIMFNFCVTAAMQWIGTFPLILLFGRDKGEGAAEWREGRRARHVNDTASRDDENDDRSAEIGRPLFQQTDRTLVLLTKTERPPPDVRHV